MCHMLLITKTFCTFNPSRLVFLINMQKNLLIDPKNQVNKQENHLKDPKNQVNMQENRLIDPKNQVNMQEII